MASGPFGMFAAQKWSKLIKSVGTEFRGCEARGSVCGWTGAPSSPHLLLQPYLIEKQGAHSSLAMPPLPVNLQHPSSASTGTRPSAEHHRKGRVCLPCSPIASHPSLWPQEQQAGNQLPPSLKIRGAEPNG